MKPFFNKIKEDSYSFLVGFFMGCANVIPGVSGGTMLFIMGAFNKLIDTLKAIGSLETLKLLCKGDFKAIFRRADWRFLFFLMLGVLFSFATLAKLTVYLLENHAEPTRAFFFGLILASIITVNHQMKKWNIPSVISLIVSGIVAFIIISLVPVNPGDSWYILLLCGAICIVAMILPGLSGSFLLLILGQYDRVWNAVGNIARLKFDLNEISMLVLLAIGCVIGLGAFVHLINFLMKNFENVTIAALIGFMVGSMPRIWPFQHDDISSIVIQKGKPVATRIIYDMPSTFDSTVLLALLCALAGLGLVLGIERFAKLSSSKKAENKE